MPVINSELMLGLLLIFDDLAQYADQDPVALKAVNECRGALDKLVSKMDNLEPSFDKIAERSCKCEVTFFSEMTNTSNSAIRFETILISQTL